LEGDTPQTATQDYQAPPKAMKGRKLQIENFQEQVIKQFLNCDVLEITYEEITNGSESVSTMPVRAAESICSFLGVELVPLTTRMVKVAPQNVRVYD